MDEFYRFLVEAVRRRLALQRSQSLCDKSPAFSCYTARYFMPMKDSAVRCKVTGAKASRAIDGSSANSPLRRTIEGAEQVTLDNETQHEGEDE